MSYYYAYWFGGKCQCDITASWQLRPTRPACAINLRLMVVFLRSFFYPVVKLVATEHGIDNNSPRMSLARVIASFVGQVASGTPIWKITAPAFIHDSRSLLDLVMEAQFSNKDALARLDQIDTMEDAHERLATILAWLVNPHKPQSTKKPFNSVLGEFICLETSVDGKTYSFVCEMVSHDPPRFSVKCEGPSFSIANSESLSTAENFKMGLKGMSITQENQFMNFESKNGKKLRFHIPGLTIGPFVFGKQTSGPFGPMRIEDAAGLTFVGTLSKTYAVEGELQHEGQTPIKVSGSFLHGVFYQDTRKIWLKPLATGDVEHQPHRELANHEKVIWVYPVFA